MTSITYQVAGTQTPDDGSIATFDFIPNNSVEPIRTSPITALARAGTVFQRTTLELENRVNIAQDGITETELLEWRRFFISQMFSNETFEYDASDVPGINAVLQCLMEPQDYSASIFACKHYLVNFNALVISSA